MIDAEEQLRGEFYQRVVDRAVTACARWSQACIWFDQALVLRPLPGIAQPLQHWPRVHGSPGFVLDKEAVQDTFAEVLRLGSEVSLRELTRTQLRLAERKSDDAMLTDFYINLIVQVAVFGEVFFL